MLGPKSDLLIQLEKAIVGVLVLIVLALGFAAVDRRLIYKMISTRTGHLIPIATSGVKSGDTRRKVLDDVLWLPMKSKESIFVGDHIFSGNQSSLEIFFSKDNSLTIGPNSLIRIATYRNKPLINLMQGEVKTDFQNKDTAYIQDQSGIKDGSHFADPATLNKPVKKFPQPVRPVEDKKLLTKVFPEDKAIFLHYGRGRIVLTSGKPCLSDCKIELRGNSQSASFKAGQVAVLPIDVGSIASGTFTWVLTDGSTAVTREFEVHPYKKEIFQSALKNSRPVEVLTD